MRVVIFGATGMVGQGVLRECLLDAGVERVLAVGRAMLAVARRGASKVVLENRDINALAG